MFYLQYGFFNGLPLYMSKNGNVNSSIYESLNFKTKEDAECAKKELDYANSFKVVERNNDFTVKEFLEKHKSKYENKKIVVGDKLLNYKECSKYNNREIKRVYNFNDDIYTIIDLKN